MRKRWICALAPGEPEGAGSRQPAGAAGPGGWGWGWNCNSSPGRGGHQTDPRPPSQQRPSWEERACLFSSATGRGGGRKQSFKAVSPFVIPARSHPPQPRLHSRTWGGGSCPGRNPLKRGGSGYSRGAGEESGPSQPDTEHSGRLVSGSTWSLPWDPLGPSGLERKERGRGWKIWEWRGPGPRVRMGQDGVWVVFFFFFLGGDPGFFCPGV